MPKLNLTDMQVEQEIEKLQGSEYVKLAKKEQYIKNARRQHLWTLRSLEKRGKQLAAMGFDLSNIHDMFKDSEE